MLQATMEQAPQVTRSHLLVVDDDDDLRHLLERYLGEHGFEVSGVADGREMRAFLAGQTVDLIILDLMLPGEDGLMLAQAIRQAGTTPILMLSARGEEIDRIVGLEMGADDYMPKPFNARELLARIKALLRRSQPVETAPAAIPRSSPDHKPDREYQFDQFTLDIKAHSVTRGDEAIPMTTAEFSLLRVFVENPGAILSRDDLVQQLKGYERQPYDRSIDVRVTRLRKKIEPDPTHPVFIRTVWGKGYQFTPEPAAESA